MRAAARSPIGRMSRSMVHVRLLLPGVPLEPTDANAGEDDDVSEAGQQREPGITAPGCGVQHGGEQRRDGPDRGPFRDRFEGAAERATRAEHTAEQPCDHDDPGASIDGRGRFQKADTSLADAQEDRASEDGDQQD